ncbi:hypothetical protein [Bacillus cereus]|uniref:hypothetical protein n=1 Tax=Bacillus cereus TaxID=1396 RepID=UPI003F64BE2A
MDFAFGSKNPTDVSQLAPLGVGVSICILGSGAKIITGIEAQKRTNFSTVQRQIYLINERFSLIA